MSDASLPHCDRCKRVFYDCQCRTDDGDDIHASLDARDDGFYDADGNRVFAPAQEPGPPVPCARCGVLAERGHPFAARLPFAGRGASPTGDVSGVQCAGCYAISQQSLREWAEGFR